MEEFSNHAQPPVFDAPAMEAGVRRRRRRLVEAGTVLAVLVVCAGTAVTLQSASGGTPAQADPGAAALPAVTSARPSASASPTASPSASASPTASPSASPTADPVPNASGSASSGKPGDSCVPGSIRPSSPPASAPGPLPTGSPVPTGAGASASSPSPTGTFTPQPQASSIVPNVIGQTEESAERTLAAAGFKFALTGPACPHLPSDTVTAQQPAAGAVVVTGFPVLLAVSPEKH
ncbi:PASTA domain-containing protein [Kitasatospora sp. NPDC006697]|uniref:PASTA domain-containing protein n=1 Tax=Kitasatospora sp. NPDC006697 TaxID=3364020 RepID=UPI0036CAB7A2